uniref:Gag-Pol polyprotein n=1 Tax=Tanacetum cinerariifolium TaxID=118510 RepID=A0A6L2MDA4_TANCI|nr:Gag-Pol polyprotein [Tanacetum cinerariifolium]
MNLTKEIANQDVSATTLATLWLLSRNCKAKNSPYGSRISKGIKRRLKDRRGGDNMKVVFGVSFYNPDFRACTIWCCEVGGGGGGVVGGVSVVYGDDVDRGVGGADCEVKAPISAMIVRVPEKDRWCEHASGSHVSSSIGSTNGGMHDKRMTIETHNWASSAHQELHKIVRDEIFPIVNQVDVRLQNFEIQFLKEAAKFVRDFKSLANEADASLAKHKILELEIKRLLKAVVSQDIMIIVQNESVGGTSDLQTELERMKERFKNCIIKKEIEYAKLWNDWYKKCDECKYDKISYDKAYKDMQQKIERLQAQLGDLKGKSKDTSSVSDTQNLLSQKLKNKNVELEFQVLNFARENAYLKATYKNLFDSISVSNTKHDRVPSASKSSRNKNKEAEVEEHYRNLLLSKNNKLISSACNNIKIDSQDGISKVVCAMCKTCLISVNHDKCLSNYVNGKNSCGKNQKAKVSIKEIQKTYQPKVSKPKKVGTRESLATPKPRKSRLLLRWSPTGKLFDNEGKIVDSSKSKSKSDCSNGDNACTSNILEPKIKRFPNSTSLLDRTVRFGNDHVAAILGFGDLQWENILITRVCFVEGLGHNLFSVGQFCDSDLEASASPICLMARASSTKSWLWHQRLSHLNFDTINDLARNDLVAGLPKFKYHKEYLCPSCEQGNRKRASHPPKPVPNSRQILHLLHMDLCGPMRIASINGKHFLTIAYTSVRREECISSRPSYKDSLHAPPPGFTDSTHSDYVFLLQNSLYDLKTPIDTEKKLEPEGSPVTDPTLYRILAGSLQYLTFTRPDLSYAVQQLCLYMHDPRETHLNAMKHVLHYLRGTTDLGLQLFRSTTSQLIAYSNAD